VAAAAGSGRLEAAARVRTAVQDARRRRRLSVVQQGPRWPLRGVGAGRLRLLWSMVDVVSWVLAWVPGGCRPGSETSDPRWRRDARVAIVTAAARGIGAAVLDGLARAGWTVVDEDPCVDVEGVDYLRSRPGDLESRRALVARARPR
jgi:hypothetical protein